MRSQLVLEKLNPELIHMKGSKNIVADAFSRLNKIDNLNNNNDSNNDNNNNNKVEPTLESLCASLALNKEDILRPDRIKTSYYEIPTKG